MNLPIHLSITYLPKYDTSVPVGGCLDGNGRVKLLCAPRGSLYVPL